MRSTEKPDPAVTLAGTCRPPPDQFRSVGSRTASAALTSPPLATLPDRAVFGVAVSSVVKWSQRERRTGSVAPGRMGGHRRAILEPHRELILARLKERPETTLAEMRDLLVAERGVRVSLDTIWRFLRAERQTYKKKPAGERDRAP